MTLLMQAYFDAWFSTIDRLHYTPRWRVLRRRKLNQQLDRLENKMDSTRPEGAA